MWLCHGIVFQKRVHPVPHVLTTVVHMLLRTWLCIADPSHLMVLKALRALYWGFLRRPDSADLPPPLQRRWDLLEGRCHITGS